MSVDLHIYEKQKMLIIKNGSERVPSTSFLPNPQTSQPYKRIGFIILSKRSSWIFTDNLYNPSISNFRYPIDIDIKVRAISYGARLLSGKQAKFSNVFHRLSRNLNENGDTNLNWFYFIKHLLYI
jgi:hypothetical protein